MKTIFILSNESQIVKATKSLDEMELWKVNGGLVTEVPMYDSEFLNVNTSTSEIFIEAEEDLALVTFETYEEDDVICIGRIFIEVDGVVKGLEDYNFTAYLKRDIEYAVEVEKERLQVNYDQSRRCI